MFKELLLLFPDHIIHIGGDEVALGIKAWESNAAVKDMHLYDLNEVEHHFLRRVADSLIKQKAVVMCWDEAVSAGLPVENTIVTWWRQNKPETLTAALSAHYPVILCPRLPLYFDFIQDSTHVSGRTWGDERRFNPYTAVYNFPNNTSLPVLGVQANLWTETVISEKRLQFLTFPRLAALAEAAWTMPEKKDEQLFSQRLRQHLLLYKEAGLYYYNPFSPEQHPEAVDVSVKSVVKD